MLTGTDASLSQGRELKISGAKVLRFFVNRVWTSPFPHVSKQFVARFAYVPLWLGMAENVEAASSGALDDGPVPQLEDIVEVTGLMLQECFEECVTSNLLMCLGSEKFHFQKMLCSLAKCAKFSSHGGSLQRAMEQIDDVLVPSMTLEEELTREGAHLGAC